MQRKTTGGKPKKLTLLEFKMGLARQFIGAYRAPRKRSLTLSVDPMGNSHMPSKGKKGRCPESSHQGGGRHESSTQVQTLKSP